MKLSSERLMMYGQSSYVSSIEDISGLFSRLSATFLSQSEKLSRRFAIIFFFAFLLLKSGEIKRKALVIMIYAAIFS